MRERYRELRADEAELLRLLTVGADKARCGVAPTLARHVREDGLRAVAVIRTFAIAQDPRCSARTQWHLHYADAEPVVVFVVAVTALGGVARAIGIATQSVRAHFGPG